ncbi:murein DD-endopeptidase MepM/ murein hydrolase activator NlpD [Shimia isoporae]|uniref:Murein DD-endopeptidase MepM/ murein hydrolase activator NlpD n=1 Tax=Shimia isoporae TaxID=647720 RepID=A0A4R1NPP5_9RHOB|nr:LysM peptidoglycan-binding domain-containing M23 family metallopeptidase [Shimia isoporae]TCL09819.1 murein DD-endopeptidase MepM/ murein hydrolase activator NlpD [Shimia isoporae]
MGNFPSLTFRTTGACLALAIVAGCSDGFDIDLRSDLGGGLDTTNAAQGAAAKRPQPDARGVISYPSYQVVVAKQGDTLNDVATRIGVDANQLGVYNGIKPDTALRAGEVLALPTRVAEPSAATNGGVDIASLAGGAIDRAQPDVETETLESAPAAAAPQTGVEPIQHKVKRGETAFTISRLYNVSVRALADWNGLDSDFTIRENQVLLIPPTDPESSKNAAAVAAGAVFTQPGQGSPTPTPPSSTKPLPKDTSAAAAKPPENNLGSSQSASKAAMSFPVDGKIVRPYSKGKNNGIDIAAKAGAPVKAAASGTVAAITTDGDNVKILVVRHPDNLMTVYYNVDDVKVAKGASVKRGQTMASLPAKDSFVHFEVRKGFDSVDPMPYLK